LLTFGLTTFTFLVWALSPQRPVEGALQSAPQIEIRQKNQWLAFTPTNTEPQTGLIFYPGGHVDFRAYNQPLSQIAQEGFLVVVVKMPLNLAVMGANRAEAVIAEYPHIQTWAIGGHSLGGAMAARFASTHRLDIQGLVLWGAYPPSSVDLSNHVNLAAAVLYATHDGVSTPEEILGTRAQFPPHTRFSAIEGGNHAQFGNYGHQNGDLQATISPADQQRQTVILTISLLKLLESNK